MKVKRTHGALIAARYSTDNQHDDSIEIQIQKCTEYCQQNDIPVLDIYADYAVSGMKSHRTQLDRMLEDLRSGKGDTVVILDQSRLMRSMPQWFALRQEIASLGVQLVSVTQPFVGGDTRDPNTFMMEGQTAIVNHMWVLLTRQKVLAKMRHLASTGQHTGGVPALGYRVETDGERKILVVDEAEAAVVRRIFTEYASGKSYKSIIDGLNADGITTKRGSRFGSNSLHDLLKNEKYIGTLVYGSKTYRLDGSRNTHAPEGTDVIRMENALPAIISKDLFRQVQERMGENRRAQGGRPATARDYPLRGKVYCGTCGSPMHVRASRGSDGNHTYHYYACNSKKDRHDDCGNKPIRVDQLEALVAKYVRTIVGNPEMMQGTMDRIRQATQDIRQNGAARAAQLADRLFDLQAQINNIVDAVAAGASSAALLSRLSALEGEKAKVEENMAELKRAADMAALPAWELDALVQHIAAAALDDDAAVFSIVTRVEVYPDRLIIFTAFDPDPGKKKTPTTTDREMLQTQGTPSGVPSVFITTIGLAFVVARKS